MKELYEIDMEKEQYSKTIDKIPTPDIDISMGRNVSCPFIGKAFDDNWNLPDPTGKAYEDFINTIKQIEGEITKIDSIAD